MRLRSLFIVAILFLAACRGGSAEDSGIPTLAPTINVNESPRDVATPTPSLPPTFTPVPAESQGHIFNVNEGSSVSSPVFSGTRFIYTVQRGDTLGRIAERYGVSVNDLVTLNKIANPNLIEVGQQLIIPGSGN